MYDKIILTMLSTCFHYEVRQELPQIKVGWYLSKNVNLNVCMSCDHSKQ